MPSNTARISTLLVMEPLVLPWAELPLWGPVLCWVSGAGWQQRACLTLWKSMCGLSITEGMVPDTDSVSHTCTVNCSAKVPHCTSGWFNTYCFWFFRGSWCDQLYFWHNSLEICCILFKVFYVNVSKWMWGMETSMRLNNFTKCSNLRTICFLLYQIC